MNFYEIPQTLTLDDVVCRRSMKIQRRCNEIGTENIDDRTCGCCLRSSASEGFDGEGGFRVSEASSAIEKPTKINESIDQTTETK